MKQAMRAPKERVGAAAVEVRRRGANQRRVAGQPAAAGIR